MARTFGHGRVVGNALAAATAETVIQLVPAVNHRIALIGYGLGSRGTSNTQAPGQVDIVRQAEAGTASPLTLTKDGGEDAATLDITGQQTFTAEPATTTPQRTHGLHPQAAFDIRDAYSHEITAGGAAQSGSFRLGIRATFPDVQTVEAYLQFEE